jgi:hypothetical protein
MGLKHPMGIVLAAQLFLCASAQSAEPVDGSAASHVCTANGMFGIRFGATLPNTPATSAFSSFGPGCHFFVPQTPSPYFDRYAACMSEFGGGVYEIQASRTFDTTPPPGASSLTPAQIQANRALGWKTLEGVLADHPEKVAARAEIDRQYRVATARVGGGVVLEVSNAVGWEVDISCKQEKQARDVYRRRVNALFGGQ